MSNHLQRREQKQKQIRWAAQTLFLEQGFERTTMDAIAAAAHVSKQTLYRYYASKEQLFADILVAFTRPETLPSAPEPANAFVDHAEFAQVLCQVAEEIVTRLMEPEYLAFVRVVIAESARLPQLSPLLYEAVIAPGQRRFAALWTQATAAGLIASVPTNIAVRLFIGPLLTYVLADGLFARQERPVPPPVSEIAEIVRLFLAAVSVSEQPHNTEYF